MLKAALLILAIAAAGGLVLATHILRGRFPSWALSLLHAALGASGIALLLLITFQGGGSARVMAALGLLLVAALGGFYLASLHVRSVIAPKTLVVLHAGLAIAGFLALASAAVS